MHPNARTHKVKTSCPVLLIWPAATGRVFLKWLLVRAVRTCAQAAIRETPDVKEFLFNPMVDIGKKRDLLSSLANDAGLSKHTLNFLNLLLDSDRLVAMEQIFDAFQTAYCRLTDTQARHAPVTCAAQRMLQKKGAFFSAHLAGLLSSPGVQTCRPAWPVRCAHQLPGTHSSAAP